MLVIYTVPGCPSVRRVKLHLKEHETVYTEKNLYRVLLNDAETAELIRMTKTDYPADVLRDNPSLLERPVIICDEEDSGIAAHLKELRDAHCTKDCARWSICGKVRKP